MSNTDSRWKEKYSRLLDDYERLEQNTRERTGLLERGLVRSSLAAEGQDPKLDRQLQALRDSVRASNSTQLQQVVHDIERHLLATENQRQERQHTLLSALDQLCSQLLANNKERGTRQALKKLQGALKDHQQVNHTLHDWLHELSRLQAAVLQHPEDSGNSGMLDRLFGRHVKTADTTPPETATANTPVPMPVDATPAAITDAGATAPSMAAVAMPDMGALYQALIRLLDELPLPDEDKEAASALRARLVASTGWNSLESTLEQLTVLVIRANSKRQQEFSHYLQQLNSKLNLITSSVSQTRDSYQSSVDSAASLDQHLHSQVNELHQDVQQIADLEQLKQRVDQRLNLFMETLARHQQQRKESEQKLLQRLQDLGERVHLVENEASQLTSQLVEQHEKARRDALTGLPNRTAWDERLQIEYLRLQRQTSPLLLAVIDVDHFKRINDTYGHLAGDKVLKILATRLQQGIRKTDFMARYGGEEFVILLPDTPLDNGAELLNKLRQHIADCPFHFKGEPVQITFSAGITRLQADEDPASAFARADQALYAAKQGGRNQVRSAAADGPCAAPAPVLPDQE